MASVDQLPHEVLESLLQMVKQSDYPEWLLQRERPEWSIHPEDLAERQGVGAAEDGQSEGVPHQRKAGMR